MKAGERLIVALDVDSQAKALELVAKLKAGVAIFKVGLELFSSAGPGIVKAINAEGGRVFLDLKLHDIPNTAAKAAVSLSRLQPFILNVHALGGYEMMKRTGEAVKEACGNLKCQSPKIIAVTILTGSDENNLKKIGITDNMKSVVLRLAGLAKDAGLDGVVASAEEAAELKKAFGPDFLVVTPGVRPKCTREVHFGGDDQKRIATPKAAVEAGADYIVVGRPIIEAPDPAEAARKIVSELTS